MMILYFFAAIFATFLLPAAVLRGWAVAERAWTRFRTLLALVLIFAGCDAGGLLEVRHDAGPGGASTTTTTTSADPCATLNCQAPQECGGGCATDGTRGCYTPGGSLDAGPWDCPSCFSMPEHDDAACGNAAGYPAAYFCQVGAQALGGCVLSHAMTGYECCPAGVDGGSSTSSTSSSSTSSTSSTSSSSTSSGSSSGCTPVGAQCGVEQCCAGSTCQQVGPALFACEPPCTMMSGSACTTSTLCCNCINPCVNEGVGCGGFCSNGKPNNCPCL